MKDKGIFDAIKAYLDTLSDDELLGLGDEFNRIHDRDCTWAWRMEVDEEMHVRAEGISCQFRPSIRDVLDVMEWAQSAKGYEFIDYEGSFMNRDDFLEQARWNLDELAELVEGGISWSGTLDVYESIDTDELQELIEKTDEWQESYGEDEE